MPRTINIVKLGALVKIVDSAYPGPITINRSKAKFQYKTGDKISCRIEDYSAFNIPIADFSIEGTVVTDETDFDTRLATVFPNAGAAIVPFKCYTAIFNQTGTDDPTVLVLENDLGSIIWTRDNLGYYIGTLANAFTINKTFSPQNNIAIIETGYGDPPLYLEAKAIGEDSFFIKTRDVAGYLSDAILLNRFIEIRVYL